MNRSGGGAASSSCPNENTACGATRLVAMLVAILISLALAGCGIGSGDSKSSADLTSEAASEGAITGSDEPAVLTGSPILGAVVWSTAVQPGTNEPIAPVDSFPDTSPVLYAVFPIDRFPAGSTIRATWTFNGDSLDGFEQEVTAPIDRVSGWLEFHLERTNSEPWPDGSYAIALVADSVLVATGEVQVTAS